MKDRIRQIMESQHMTQQVFADFIGLAPATLSSIYNERTRPTLSVVEAIKKKIPNISTDWLMFGSGDMYISDETSPQPSDGSTLSYDNPGQMTHPIPSSPMLDFDHSQTSAPQMVTSTPHAFNSVKSTRPELSQMEVKVIDKPQRRVIEIRVFYDDQTWDTFIPQKK